MKPRAAKQAPTPPSLLRWPLHPLLFAAYPVLALLAANLRQVERWVVYRPLAAALLLAVILLLGLRALLRDGARAALLASFALLLIFSYGHVYSLLETAPAPWSALGRHRALAPLVALLAAAGTWAILRLRAPRGWTMPLNVAALTLVVMALAQIGLYALRTPAPAATVEQGQLAPPPGQTAPDIYYIILDAYTRADILQSAFGVDNQAFLDGLRDLGFSVAMCSRSNYSSTELSLASALNMDYLDAFGQGYQSGGSGYGSLPDLIQHSRVRQLLEDAGYQSVAFETGFYWSQWMDADMYLSPGHSALLTRRLRPFETLLLKSSAALLLLDSSSALPAAVREASLPHAEHIQRTRFLLDKLPTLPDIAGPKLVFAHILVPHNPQVFLPDGSINPDINFYSDGDRPINDEYFREGYAGQVQFINSRILAIVSDILARSKTPPVIILQGDHGIKPPDYHAILNAYYLPESGAAQVYDTITPVNSLRLALNSALGGDFALLPDRSFTLDTDNPGAFIESPAPVCQP